MANGGDKKPATAHQVESCLHQFKVELAEQMEHLKGAEEAHAINVLTAVSRLSSDVRNFQISVELRMTNLEGRVDALEKKVFGK